MRTEPILIAPTVENTYWRNVKRGHALYERGVVPLFHAQTLAYVASYAREPRMRRLARQAVTRWGLGELIGERRGAVMMGIRDG